MVEAEHQPQPNQLPIVTSEVTDLIIKDMGGANPISQ